MADGAAAGESMPSEPMAPRAPQVYESREQSYMCPLCGYLQLCLIIVFCGRARAGFARDGAAPLR